MQAQSAAGISNEGPAKLHPLISYLDSLTARVDLVQLGSILAELNVSAEDLAAILHFNPHHYVRNKVSSSNWYDLLVMCWGPRQFSAIHDHTDSSCGFKIVKGVSTETAYELSGKGPYVRPAGSRCYQQGEICLAQDSAIHRISNESASEELITLHIYSPPLKMSNYEEDPSLISKDKVISLARRSSAD